MVELYADRDWLYDQYITKNKSSLKIADEIGVSKRTILNYLGKFGIVKPKENVFPDRRVLDCRSRTSVAVVCMNCGAYAEKTQQYIDKRQKIGRTDFYCSRECTDEAHSRAMKGENNPNYEGTWHGPNMLDYSEEKRKEIIRKGVETRIQRGTSKGSRNGRWAGGQSTHNCFMCGKPSEFRPHVHRKIIAGQQRPCCSVQCATAIGRRSQEWKRTSIEIAMAGELGRRGINYNEQYNLGDKFILDFFLPDHRIVIECDGDYWHTREDVIKRDKRKNAYINACGFKLFRFWEHEINEDVGACVDEVMAEINNKVK